MLEAKPTAAGFPLASVLVAIRCLRTFTHGGVALAVVLVRLISSTPGLDSSFQQALPNCGRGCRRIWFSSALGQAYGRVWLRVRGCSEAVVVDPDRNSFVEAFVALIRYHLVITSYA
jgi:hypothetical protein